MKHRRLVIAATAAILLVGALTYVGRNWGGWSLPVSRIEMAPVARQATAQVEVDTVSPAAGRPAATGFVPMGPPRGARKPREQPRQTPRAVADGVPYWCFRTFLPGLPWMMSTHESNNGNAARSDTESIWNGERSLRLHFEPIDVLGPGARAEYFQRNVLWQAIRAEPYRGKRIVFRPYLRAEPGGSITAFLRSWNGGGIGPLLVTAGLPVAAMPTAAWGAAWGNPRLVLEVPADAEIIYYGIAQAREHPVWIDHVEVSLDTLSAPPSRAAISSSNFVKDLPPLPINPNWVWDEPKNLDFEIVYPADDDAAAGNMADGRELPLRC
jgi:hypothetical protein